MAYLIKPSPFYGAWFCIFIPYKYPVFMSLYRQVLHILGYFNVPVPSSNPDCPYTTIRYNTSTELSEYFDANLCAWIPIYDCDQPNGVCTYNLGRFRTDDGNNDIVIGRGYILNGAHVADYFYLDGNPYTGNILWPCVTPTTGLRFGAVESPLESEALKVEFSQLPETVHVGKFEIAVRTTAQLIKAKFWKSLSVISFIGTCVAAGMHENNYALVSALVLALTFVKGVYFKAKGIQRYFIGVYESEDGKYVFGYVRYYQGKPLYQYYDIQDGSIYKGKITSTFIK